MNKLDCCFGIDFGTTNSATVSKIEGIKTTQYGDDSGNPFPSLLLIDKITGETYCGRSAWERRRELSETCEVIHSVKNFLGTDKKWIIAGKEWTPEMVTAQIFMGLKNQVLKKSGGNLALDEAVISVPIGYSPIRRKSLRRAASLAGISVKSFISEPTAALLKNYNEIKKYSKIAIFDWGGGTLDISVIENKNGKIFELSVLGLNSGGDDIDLKIAKWAHSKIVEKENLNISFVDMPPRYQDIMLVKSEIAKRNLSEVDSTTITINKYGDLEFVRVYLDIDTLSKLIEIEISKAINLLEEAVSKAGLSLLEIECILMVGGSSNLRPLLEKIEDRWSEINIQYPNNSEWYVAEGASLVSRNPGCFRLNQDLGVLLSNGQFFPLIPSNSILPFKETEFSFGIVEDSRDARFIFCENNNSIRKNYSNVLGNISVPTYGFYKEQLKLKAYITEDLVFNAEIKSDRKPDQYKKYWTFPNLKFYYDLNI